MNKTFNYEGMMSMNTHITSELRLFQEKKDLNGALTGPNTRETIQWVRTSNAVSQDHLCSSQKPHKERRKGNAT